MGNQKDVGGGERTHVQQPALPGVQYGQLPLRPRQSVQHLGGVPVKGAAGGSESYAPGQPDEQRSARLLFQCGDPPGHGGLRVVEANSRLREGTTLRHCHEQPKSIVVEHPLTTSRLSGSPVILAPGIPCAHGIHAIQSLVECRARS